MDYYNIFIVLYIHIKNIEKLHKELLMLEIKNLVKRYGNAELPTVKGISFQLRMVKFLVFLARMAQAKPQQ